MTRRCASSVTLSVRAARAGVALALAFASSPAPPSATIIHPASQARRRGRFVVLGKVRIGEYATDADGRSATVVSCCSGHAGAISAPDGPVSAARRGLSSGVGNTRCRPLALTVGYANRSVRTR